MCPYTCICDIIKGILGKIGTYIVKDRFRNIDLIEKIECNILFIHGKKDSLISYEHSI